MAKPTNSDDEFANTLDVLHSFPELKITRDRNGVIYILKKLSNDESVKIAITESISDAAGIYVSVEKGQPFVVSALGNKPAVLVTPLPTA